MTTKVSFSHVSYIHSLPSSGDCPTLYVEADFSMDGSDLLTSQLTSESCPCDLKGFYILYSHICISLTLSSDFTSVSVWKKMEKRSNTAKFSWNNVMYRYNMTVLETTTKVQMTQYGQYHYLLVLWEENSHGNRLLVTMLILYLSIGFVSGTMNVSELALFKPVSFVFRYRANREEWLLK